MSTYAATGMDNPTAVQFYDRGTNHARVVVDELGADKSFEPYVSRIDILEGWVSASRRIYLRSTFESQPYRFHAVSVDGSFSTPVLGAFAVAGPLRASADGSAFLSAGDGKLLTGDLAAKGAIANKVTDGTWRSDGLFTVRVHSAGLEVQKWTGSDHHLSGAVTLPGRPHRIFSVDDSTVVVVATVGGHLAFHLVSTTPALLATVFNDGTGGFAKPALFDANAYLAQNPDVAAQIGDAPDRAQKAWDDYWNTGILAGRTDGDFVLQDYLAKYPELAANYASDIRLAAYHWYTVGRLEGRRIPAGFDVAGYYARNQDIAAILGNDKYGAWLHYYNYGVWEGRTFDANFIPAEYLELNTDIKAAIGGNLQEATMHWLTWGHPMEDRMGRVPIGFNVDSYLARYSDLAAAFANVTPVAVRNVAVWNHYIAYGTLEGRSDGDFEAYHYLATNPDLAEAFGDDIRGAALHWYFYGRREGRRIPGAFNVQNYRALYPDLIVFAGDDLYGCWLHYRDVGILEGRIYDNLFRPDEYLALNLDIAAVVGNNYRDALLHWLYYGIYEGRMGRNF
jgi:hypothetical protein